MVRRAERGRRLPGAARAGESRTRPAAAGAEGVATPPQNRAQDTQDPLCPQCRTALRVIAGADWRTHRCATCQGVAVQVESLRRIATPQRAAELWKLLPEGVAGRPCPWCAGPLSEVQLTLDDRRLALDVCRTCQGAWFDAKELATFTPTPPAPLRGPRLSPSARLAVGLAKVEADALGRKAVTQAGTAVVILYAVLRVLRRLLR